MNGRGRCAADAEYGLEQARARPEIGDLPQEFNRVPLGLQRVVLRAVALQRNALRMQLQPSARRPAQHAAGADRRARAQILYLRKAGRVLVVDDLDSLHRRTVEKVHESE